MVEGIQLFRLVEILIIDLLAKQLTNVEIRWPFWQILR